jgi:hypothetical protein
MNVLGHLYTPLSRVRSLLQLDLTKVDHFATACAPQNQRTVSEVGEAAYTYHELHRDEPN